MNKQDKLWYLLSLFIIGVAIYEYGAKNVTHLETMQQDYSSVTHSFYLTVLTAGLCISACSMLQIYVYVKHGLYSITKTKD